ncbi:MAG: hypothetical protein ACK5LC_12320 [Coprobacillaceae bacterium]
MVEIKNDLSSNTKKRIFALNKKFIIYFLLLFYLGFAYHMNLFSPTFVNGIVLVGILVLISCHAIIFVTISRALTSLHAYKEVITNSPDSILFDNGSIIINVKNKKIKFEKSNIQNTKHWLLIMKEEYIYLRIGDYYFVGANNLNYNQTTTVQNTFNSIRYTKPEQKENIDEAFLFESQPIFDRLTVIVKENKQKKRYIITFFILSLFLVIVFIFQIQCVDKLFLYMLCLITVHLFLFLTITTLSEIKEYHHSTLFSKECNIRFYNDKYAILLNNDFYNIYDINFIKSYEVINGNTILKTSDGILILQESISLINYLKDKNIPISNS